MKNFKIIAFLMVVSSGGEKDYKAHCLQEDLNAESEKRWKEFVWTHCTNKVSKVKLSKLTILKH